MFKFKLLIFYIYNIASIYVWTASSRLYKKETIKALLFYYKYTNECMCDNGENSARNCQVG